MAQQPSDLSDLSALKLAVLARRLRRDESDLEVLEAEPVAVVGMGCRFPGSPDPRGFWELLKDGRHAITEIPPERWDVEAHYDEDPRARGKMRTRWGGFVDDVALFDAAFFGISRREATAMDPQQRLFLEVAWEALEDAGQDAEALAGSSTGVFVGVTNADYLWRQGGDLSRVELYNSTGTAVTFTANRLSYFLDLRGPSMALDTACSSSLVAVHLACRSLRARECDLAIAGGVNLMLSPFYHVAFSKGQMLAPDGRCKTFDARADGYVRGEGAGAVALKRLSDALADSDRIVALVRGSAVNQDGLANGLTAPNGLAQQAVIRAALRKALVDPDRVMYVEAHGTGTPLGDPIEVEALIEAYGLTRRQGPPCSLGAVKTNIGHLEAAAGIAGFIKTALALHHGTIPAHLNFEKLNPHITAAPCRIPTEGVAWPAGPRLAGLSSFGAGGTNAHVILEEAPAVPAPAPAGERAHLVVLSARSDAALDRMVDAAAERAAAEPAPALENLAYTTGPRRSHHSRRLSLVARTMPELLQKLEEVRHRERPAGSARGRIEPERKIAFVYSGQGAQWLGMGRQLMAEDVFRGTLERCDELLRGHGDWSLVAELEADTASSRLAQTEVAQPVLFAMQMALTELWASWGIRADALVGHSSGEVAAACAAGVLDLEEAVRVIFHRGRLMQRATGRGRMAATALSAEEAESAVEPYAERLAVAAYNSPESTVLAGETDALEEVLAELRAREVFCRPLRVDYAFHSPQMEPFRGELESVLTGLVTRPATLGLYSTVSGRRAGEGDFDAAYWSRNIRLPVRFRSAINALMDDGCSIFLELSPHTVLSMAVSQCAAHRGRKAVALPSLRREKDEQATMLGSLGTLYTLGFPVRFKSVCPPGRLIEWPTYAWQRQRYWQEVRRGPSEAPGHNSLLGIRRRLAHVPGEHVFELELDEERLAFLGDHRVQGIIILPGTAYIEMVLASAAALYGAGSRQLSGISYEKALFVPDGAVFTVQVVLTPGSDGRTLFRIYSVPSGGRNSVSPPFSPEGGNHEPGQDDAPWVLHVTGELREGAGEPPDLLTSARREELTKRSATRTSGEDFYAHHAARGNQWGPCFQGVEELWQGAGQALARVSIPPALAAEVKRHQFHPAVLDACGQALAAAVPEASGGEADAGFVLGELDGFHFYDHPCSLMWALVPEPPVETGESLKGDVQIFDGEGRPLAFFRGLRMKYLEGLAARPTIPENPEQWLHEIVWEEAKQPVEAAEPGGGWLILADRGGVGERLAARLEENDQRVVRISRGLDPSAAELFRELLANAFGREEQALRGILHLWSLDADPEARPASAGDSVVHLIRALASRVPGPAPRLWLVTRGAQAAGNTSVAPVQAPIWGLGRTAAHEHPELRTTLVDLGPGEDASQAVAALWNEIRMGDGEDQIAWRGNRRLVARLVRLRDADLGPEIDVGDGSYLITGGLGGLGLVVARWLAEQGARVLILIGRTPLPPRSAWDDPSLDERLLKRIEAVRGLEARGAEVRTVALDVADEEGLRTLFSALQEEGLAPLRGVVHAAGVLDYRAFADLDAESFESVLRPKVHGAWLLDRLTDEMPLDFFVLFSSASAILSSPFLASYAASNTFLDALAHDRRSRGKPAISIGWGVWDEVGMAVEHRGDGGRGLAPHGMGRLTPDAGLAVLARLLGHPTPHVGVMPIDWEQWGRAYPAAGRMPLFHHLVGTASSSGMPSEEAASLFSGSREDRARKAAALVRDETARILGLAAGAVDPRRPLTQMGLDSLMAVELKGRFQSLLGLSVPLVQLLQGRDLDQLTAEVLARLDAQSEVIELAPDGPEEGEAELPLSYGQQSIWVESELAPTSWAYNLLFAARVHSPLDTDALGCALQALAERHRILRTTYQELDGRPVQYSDTASAAAFEIVDASAWPSARLDERLLSAARHAFDLKQDSVIRLTLFSVSREEHVLLLVIHHIAADLWTLGILLRELGVLYSATAAGSTPELPAPAFEYADYVRWQRRRLAGPEGERLEGYWREQLAGEIPELELPLDRPRPAAPSLRGAAHLFELGPELTSRLKAVAGTAQVTLFATLLGTFQVLLQRYTGRDQVLVSSPMAGRSRNEFQALVGHFVNMVPLRSDLSEDPRVGDLLVQVQGTVLGALEHQDYPALLMVQRLLAERKTGRTALFNIEFAFDAASIDEDGVSLSVIRPGARSRLGTLELESIALPQQAGQFELSLDLLEWRDSISGILQYQVDIFDATTTRRLLRHFTTLLAAVAKGVEERISALPLFSRGELHQLVNEAPAAGHLFADAGVNASVLIVDRFLNPQPWGCVGRVAVADAAQDLSAADGPATVASRFLPAPFGPPGHRLFLTGNLGRFGAQGELQIVGRAERDSAEAAASGDDFEELRQDVLEELLSEL